MAQIVHKRGTFQTFRVLSNIHMGAYEMDLPAQTEVEFDGMVLKWGDDKYNLPLFAGAINAGWAVPIEDNVSQYVPKPAGIEVRPATSDGPERGAPMEIGKAPDEEDVFVGTVDQNNARRKAANAPPIPQASQASMEHAAALAAARRKQAEASEAAVLAEEGDETPSIQHSDDDNPVETVIQSKTFDPTPKFTQNGMEIISEDQDAVPIATIGDRNSANVGSNALGGKRTVLTNESQASTAIRMAESVKPIRTIKQASPPATESITPALDAAKVSPPPAPEVAPAPKTTPSVEKIKWERGDRKPMNRAIDAVKKYGSDPAALKQVMAQETDQTRRFIRSELKKSKR